MAVELYNKGDHVCVAFRDLVTGGAVQANQFLIFDHNHAALIDGSWKLAKAFGGEWELYRLDQDGTETHDLAGSNPEQLQRLLQRWNTLAQGMLQPPKLDAKRQHTAPPAYIGAGRKPSRKNN